jgi:hypothetical protein
MKKMKLFCGILIGLLIFSSCSNNDDSNSNSTSIVGTWKPIKEVDVCSTGSEEAYDFDSCEQTSRLIFNDNGSFSENSYYLSGNDCVLDYEDNGTWTIANGNLSVNYGSSNEQVTFFELSGNTLRLGQYDNDPNDPCDGGNLPSHYYTEFIRVE